MSEAVGSCGVLAAAVGVSGVVGSVFGATEVVTAACVGPRLGEIRWYMDFWPEQLRRPHRDLERGLVVALQRSLGSAMHVTSLERTPPPQVTGH